MEDSKLLCDFLARVVPLNYSPPRATRISAKTGSSNSARRHEMPVSPAAAALSMAPWQFLSKISVSIDFDWINETISARVMAPTAYICSRCVTFIARAYDAVGAIATRIGGRG